MAIQFRGKDTSPIHVTVVVAGKTGGPVKATYIWQYISIPTKPVIIKEDDKPAPWSMANLSAADLAAAPDNLYSMLVHLIPTDDAIVWTWAEQNGAPLAAVDGLGNPLPGEGPHKAVKLGTAAKGKTAHLPVSIDLS